MKNTEKKVKTTIGESGLVITYDEARINYIRKRLLPTAKYVELNKQVANMKLPNV